jgi:spermidine/putrescine transport system permease protein
MNPRSRWLPIHVLAVFAFLYLPILVLIVYSFNGESVGGFPPRGWTIRWYRILLDDDALWGTVGNSLLVAAAAMLLALGFGLPAALALDRTSFPGKALFRRLVLLPLILPGIITGLSLLMLFVTAGLKLSLLTIPLGPGAALPNLRLAIIGAGLLIFTLSMDEIAVSFFLIGRDNTLPLEIWSRLRRGITPEINAISTVIFLFSLGMILVWYRVRTRHGGQLYSQQDFYE